MYKVIDITDIIKVRQQDINKTDNRSTIAVSKTIFYEIREWIKVESTYTGVIDWNK